MAASVVYQGAWQGQVYKGAWQNAVVAAPGGVITPFYYRVLLSGISIFIVLLAILLV